MAKNPIQWNVPNIRNSVPYPNPRPSKNPATTPKIAPPMAPPNPIIPDTDPTAGRGNTSAGSVMMSPDHDCWQKKAMLNKTRSEEHTSELQSLRHLVCRLL